MDELCLSLRWDMWEMTRQSIFEMNVLLGIFDWNWHVV
jgi:hypothetical protein